MHLGYIELEKVLNLTTVWGGYLNNKYKRLKGRASEDHAVT